MEIQDFPITWCLHLCQTNPALKGLGHPAIGMKIHGRISEVSGAIDGVDTEFLGFVEAVRQAPFTVG